MKSFIRTLVWSSLPLLVLYTLAPLLVFLFPHFMQHLFFLNFVKFPWREYHNLTEHGVDSVGLNFYIDGQALEDGYRPRLGLWHVLPYGLKPENGNVNQQTMEKILKEDNRPVVVYLHGNSFDRTTRHRIELYKILSKMGFHVFALDYRGYGDSTGRPTEDGIVADSRCVFDYVRELIPDRPLLVWGHSMGTGVATRLVSELSQEDKNPTALVLESPFNNLRDVINNHPFSAPFRFLPWFDHLVIQPLIESGLIMQSDQRIKKITCPILVFHAADDHIIPIKLGKKLVESAEKAGRNIRLVEFEPSRAFFHKYIHRAAEVPDIVMEFFEMSKSQQTKKSP
ncbi:unnamed protein product [Bursaphelenchus xylophilus]|nr:unnamed protein product [Bursaphelenchus xylophilus]CAG9123076.1 unnamed protein product [Bursaphelenchus xylophilus]